MKDSYFQSIREYMPQAAQAALERQLPVIRQQVQHDVHSFGEALKTHIEEQVAAQTKRRQDELEATLGNIRTILAAVKAAPDTTKVDQLETAITDYENKYRGI